VHRVLISLSFIAPLTDDLLVGACLAGYGDRSSRQLVLFVCSPLGQQDEEQPTEARSAVTQAMTSLHEQAVQVHIVAFGDAAPAASPPDGPSPLLWLERCLHSPHPSVVTLPRDNVAAYSQATEDRAAPRGEAVVLERVVADSLGLCLREAGEAAAADTAEWRRRWAAAYTNALRFPLEEADDADDQQVAAADVDAAAADPLHSQLPPPPEAAGDADDGAAVRSAAAAAAAAGGLMMSTDCRAEVRLLDGYAARQEMAVVLPGSTGGGGSVSLEAIGAVMRALVTPVVALRVGRLRRDRAFARNGRLLTSDGSKGFLAAYGLPTGELVVRWSAEDGAADEEIVTVPSAAHAAHAAAEARQEREQLSNAGGAKAADPTGVRVVLIDEDRSGRSFFIQPGGDLGLRHYFWIRELSVAAGVEALTTLQAACDAPPTLAERARVSESTLSTLAAMAAAVPPHMMHGADGRGGRGAVYDGGFGGSYGGGADGMLSLTMPLQPPPPPPPPHVLPMGGTAQQSSSTCMRGMVDRRRQAAAASSSGGVSSGSGMMRGFLGANPRTTQTDAVSTPAALQMQIHQLQVAAELIPAAMSMGGMGGGALQCATVSATVSATATSTVTCKLSGRQLTATASASVQAAAQAMAPTLESAEQAAAAEAERAAREGAEAAARDAAQKAARQRLEAAATEAAAIQQGAAAAERASQSDERKELTHQLRSLRRKLDRAALRTAARPRGHNGGVPKTAPDACSSATVTAASTSGLGFALGQGFGLMSCSSPAHAADATTVAVEPQSTRAVGGVADAAAGDSLGGEVEATAERCPVSDFAGSPSTSAEEDADVVARRAATTQSSTAAPSSPIPSDVDADASSLSPSLRTTQRENGDQWAVTPAPLQAGLELDSMLLETPERDGGGGGSTHMASAATEDEERAAAGGGGGRRKQETLPLLTRGGTPLNIRTIGQLLGSMPKEEDGERDAYEQAAVAAAGRATLEESASAAKAVADRDELQVPCTPPRRADNAKRQSGDNKSKLTVGNLEALMGSFYSSNR
jgi:hypothetical protein